MSEDIKNMIDNIMADDLTTAGTTFDDLMMGRIGDAMEQEKIAVAGTAFNGTSENDVDDIEVEDDDWEDADEVLEDESED